MLWLVATALAAEVVAADPTRLSLAFGGCPHVGADRAIGREPVRTYLDAADAAQADGAWLLGDLGGCSTCYGRSTQLFNPAIGFPYPEEGADLAGQIAASTYPTGRVYALGGNHDGQPVAPDAVYPYDREWGWLATYTDPMGADGVSVNAPGTTPGAYKTILRLPCAAGDRWVDVVSISDPNGVADRGACGRRTSDDHVVTWRGMPAAAWRRGRELRFLRDSMQRAWDNGRSLIVAAHHAPPNTTRGSHAGEARAPQCNGLPYHGDHGTRGAGGVPNIVDPAWDLRFSLNDDGDDYLTACDAWGGAVAFLDDDPTPDPTWVQELIGEFVALNGGHPVIGWVASHTHIRDPSVPGLSASLQPTYLGVPIGDPLTVIQAGSLSATHATGFPMHLVMDLECDGTWTATRWSSDRTGGPCLGTHKYLPTSAPGQLQLLSPVQGTW